MSDLNWFYPEDPAIAAQQRAARGPVKPAVELFDTEFERECPEEPVARLPVDETFDDIPF